ncbi:conserved hypothetical protein [Tenacibaculum maritimum]|uniref:hypothetical protein n=1 Tax=Tenacibaculum maritimum TaxID=107401 RepID=UPI0012E55F6E|nr:hypothetical protein [Tenacibaculum maritimum]CAA0196361.1 conserved hypothetical protein [Tenacibaculum maritimum]
MDNTIEKASGTEVTFMIPDTESLGRLKTLEPKFSLNLKYRSAEHWAVLKDKPIRCFYMGLKDIPNEKGELVKCGVFVTEKECFINASMTLVEAVQSRPVKTPIQITYRGKNNNKSSEGSTMIFDTEILG